VKNPAFNAELEGVIVKALQKDPDKRYQTMAELGQAVERALAGMGHAEDDLGAYVRGVMGDRGAKRRAAVRDAVRVADERYATGTHALVTIPPQQAPQVHEGVSEIVLTKMNSGLSERMTATPPTNMVPPPPSSVSGQWGPRDSTQPEPHGTTDQPVMVPEAVASGRKSRASALFVGVAAAAAVAIMGVALLRGPNLRRAGARPPPAPTVAPAATAPPAVTVAAVAPTTSPTTEPTSSAVSINNLPDATEDVHKKKPTVSGPAPTPREPPERASVTTGAPGGAPDKGDKDKPARKVDTKGLPIFTNPGF
jgi:serine/threonine-protein kinase